MRIGNQSHILIFVHADITKITFIFIIVNIIGTAFTAQKKTKKRFFQLLCLFPYFFIVFMILYYSSSVDSISPVNPASSIIFIVASIPCPPAVRYPEAKIESTTLNKVGSIPLK